MENFEFNVSETQAVKLLTLLVLIPYYTSSLTREQEETRNDWINKIGWHFPSLMK